MTARSLLVALVLVAASACGEGVSSDPNRPDATGPMTDASLDAAGASEIEPNDERDVATILGGSGTWIIQGSCGDVSDLDYYKSSSATGTFTGHLTWSGGKELMFDPEINLSGGQVVGPSPVTYNGNATAGEVLWAVDCRDATTVGIQYAMTVMIP